jgi:hypothetical protein
VRGQRLKNSEPIFGLTPLRLAVWRAISELEKQKPSLEEVCALAGVSTTSGGRMMQWLKDQRKVTWERTRADRTE